MEERADHAMYMGAILSITFLAVSYLAHRLHVIPVADESKSVLVRSAMRSTDAGPRTALFLVLQIATTLILMLAANTASPTSPAWRASTRRRLHAPAAHEARATGWCSPTGSSPWP